MTTILAMGITARELGELPIIAIVDEKFLICWACVKKFCLSVLDAYGVEYGPELP